MTKASFPVHAFHGSKSDATCRPTRQANQTPEMSIGQFRTGDCNPCELSGNPGEFCVLADIYSGVSIQGAVRVAIHSRFVVRR